LFVSASFNYDCDSTFNSPFVSITLSSAGNSGADCHARSAHNGGTIDAIRPAVEESAQQSTTPAQYANGEWKMLEYCHYLAATSTRTCLPHSNRIRIHRWDNDIDGGQKKISSFSKGNQKS